MTSAKFKEIRKECKLTQRKLALKMGMYQQDVGRIETGKRSPTHQQAAFIRHIARWEHGFEYQEAGQGIIFVG